MHSYLINLLECPHCHGELRWEVFAQEGERIERADSLCVDCQAVYPVREGIGVFLTGDLQREDLWEVAESELARYLRENPEVAARLLHEPLHSLSPADRFYRAMVLEERGDFAAAQTIFQHINEALYTPEYMICYDSQIYFLLDQLGEEQGPVIDLASGRGELVEKILAALDRPVVFTDFSLPVLRRNRLRFQSLGYYKRLSLLAVDARQTPFKDGSVQTMTSNLGLINVQKPGPLVEELRRVVSGTLRAITLFYPPEDQANREWIEKIGVAGLIYKGSLLRQFSAAGWRVELTNLCRGAAKPTPAAELLDGAQVDALPVAETQLEWANLVAK